MCCDRVKNIWEEEAVLGWEEAKQKYRSWRENCLYGREEGHLLEQRAATGAAWTSTVSHWDTGLPPTLAVGSG